jgi:DNA processing protein
MNDDRIAQIALLLTPKIGPIKSKELIQYFGSARAVFEKQSSKDLLQATRLSPTILAALLQKQYHKAAEKELIYCQNHKISLISSQDEAYPRRLLQCAHAPQLLYLKGNVDLNARKTIAFAGTRKPTERGKMICQALVRGLKGYQPLIVSGLAYGIDIVAHKTCIEQGIPTLGVVGHGLPSIYPTAHQSTAQEMSLNGGVLSEHPTGTGIHPNHFPMRNRIIAGIADALILVETAKKGGSMITADYTQRLKRTCFAIPGRINDSQSAGCNYLIQEQKASLIQNAEDVAIALKWQPSTKKIVQGNLFAPLNAKEKELTKLLLGKEALHLEQLLVLLNLSSSQLSILLLELELKGHIRALPGKYFCLT